MKKYKTVGDEFNEEIDIVETTDPAHADNINAPIKQLFTNSMLARDIINELFNRTKDAENSINGLTKRSEEHAKQIETAYENIEKQKSAEIDTSNLVKKEDYYKDKNKIKYDIATLKAAMTFMGESITDEALTFDYLYEEPSTVLSENIFCGVVCDLANNEVRRVRSSDNRNNQLTTSPHADIASLNKFKFISTRIYHLISDTGESLANNSRITELTSNSNGQIMLKQPKFYYRCITLHKDDKGYTDKFMLLLSDLELKGFKIHPAFVSKDKKELDYIYIGALPASEIDGKLSSREGKEIVRLSPIEARRKMQQRGKNWSLLHHNAYNALQMISLVLYKTFNVQLTCGIGYSPILPNGKVGPIVLKTCDCKKTYNINSDVEKVGSSSIMSDFNSHSDLLDRNTHTYCAGIVDLYYDYPTFVEGVGIRNDRKNLVFYKSKGYGNLYVEKINDSTAKADNWEAITYSGVQYDVNGYYKNFVKTNYFLPGLPGGNSVKPIGDMARIYLPEVTQNATGICVGSMFKNSNYRYQGTMGLYYITNYRNTGLQPAHRIMYIPEPSKYAKTVTESPTTTSSSVTYGNSRIGANAFLNSDDWSGLFSSRPQFQ